MEIIDAEREAHIRRFAIDDDLNAMRWMDADIRFLLRLLDEARAEIARLSAPLEHKIGDTCVNSSGIEGTWQYNPDGWVCVVNQSTSIAPPGASAMERVRAVCKSLGMAIVTTEFLKAMSGAIDLAEREATARERERIDEALVGLTCANRGEIELLERVKWRISQEPKP